MGRPKLNGNGTKELYVVPTTPTFDEYVAARKVVIFVADELRREKFNGKLNIGSDEMIARIIYRSCARFRRDKS